MKRSHEEATNAEYDPNVTEAISILEAEAQKRIADIRQRMEFFCTSLRAQGHTQINQLLLSVRHLSMREFCHKFGADTARYLHEKVQMQKRQLPAIKKRRLNFNNKTADNKETTKKESNTRDEHHAPVKSIPNIGNEETAMSSNNDNDNNNDDKRIPDQQSEPQVSQAHTDTLSSTKVNETSQPKETQSIKTKPEEKSVPENKSESETKEEQSLTQAQQVQQQEEQQDNDEQDFGPIFVRLERKQHPQVAFKLDPQQTVQDLGSFTLEMPTEVFEQLGAKHKKRLKGQIQDIQEQLEKVQALLE